MVNVCLLSTSAADEIQQLQKRLSEFAYQISQLHSDLDTASRERNTLQAKTLTLERMHQQVRWGAVTVT